MLNIVKDFFNFTWVSSLVSLSTLEETDLEPRRQFWHLSQPLFVLFFLSDCVSRSPAGQQVPLTKFSVGNLTFPGPESTEPKSPLLAMNLMT